MIQRSMLSNRKVLDHIYLHESALSLQIKTVRYLEIRVFMLERNTDDNMLHPTSFGRTALLLAHISKLIRLIYLYMWLSNTSLYHCD